MLNVHFSLLPKWRGAAPSSARCSPRRRDRCQHHDARTGIGYRPVHLEKRVAIDDKTLATLLDELATLGAQALTEVSGRRNYYEPHAQRGDATYAAKLTKEDFHLTSSLSPRSYFDSSIGPGVPRSGESSDSGRECGVIRRRRSGECSITLRNGRVALGASGERSCWSGCARKREIHECVVVVSGARFDHDVAQWT